MIKNGREVKLNIYLVIAHWVVYGLAIFAYSGCGHFGDIIASNTGCVLLNSLLNDHFASIKTCKMVVFYWVVKIGRVCLC